MNAKCKMQNAKCKMQIVRAPVPQEDIQDATDE